MTPVLVKELEEKVECLTTENQSLISANQTLESQVSTYQTKSEQYQIELENSQKRCEHLEEEYDNLMAVIKNANRKLYGKKSERYIDEEDNPQLSLFDDIPPGASPEEAKAETEDISYQRKKKKRKADYSKLPRREKIIPVPESERHCDC